MSCRFCFTLGWLSEIVLLCFGWLVLDIGVLDGTGNIYVLPVQLFGRQFNSGFIQRRPRTIKVGGGVKLNVNLCLMN